MICTKVPILPRPLTRTFHVVPASSRDVGTHFYLGGLKNPKEHQAKFSQESKFWHNVFMLSSSIISRWICKAYNEVHLVIIVTYVKICRRSTRMQIQHENVISKVGSNGKFGFRDLPRQYTSLHCQSSPSAMLRWHSFLKVSQLAMQFL